MYLPPVTRPAAPAISPALIAVLHVIYVGTGKGKSEGEMKYYTGAAGGLVPKQSFHSYVLVKSQWA